MDNNGSQMFASTWYICSWKRNWETKRNDLTVIDFCGRQVQVYGFVPASTLTHSSYKGRTNGVVSTSVFSRNRIWTYSSAKAILFPFHAQWCNVPAKTNGRKNPPQTISIFGYDNRRNAANNTAVISVKGLPLTEIFALAKSRFVIASNTG